VPAAAWHRRAPRRSDAAAASSGSAQAGRQTHGKNGRGSGSLAAGPSRNSSWDATRSYSRQNDISFFTPPLADAPVIVLITVHAFGSSTWIESVSAKQTYRRSGNQTGNDGPPWLRMWFFELSDPAFTGSTVCPNAPRFGAPEGRLW